MNLFNLLGAEGDPKLPQLTSTLTSIKSVINVVFMATLILVALAAMIYAIYIGFRLAKAEDDGKRKEAKSHLIWAIIGALGAIAIFVLITTVFGENSFKKYEQAVVGGDTTVNATVNYLLADIFTVVSTLMQLLVVAAIFFAIYVASKLIMATDDNKRKQAKAQLLWTCIAIIAVVVLINLIDYVLWGELRTRLLSELSK